MTVRTLILAILVALGSPHGSLAAREAFEGVWARSDRECRDEDGPSSRTLIDLGDKAGPIADRYENHCRILDRRGSGSTTRVTLRCHEFWEEYTANRNGERRSETWVVTGPTRMSIDGKPFVRCIR